VWELGVGDPPLAKANKDYKTRTENPLGVDKSKTTFVFVTARRWREKVHWEQEKRAEDEWGDVRAFDADDIEVAFDSAPAAQFWFSELIGLPVDGVWTIESWWEAFIRVSQPNLTPELVLAGRPDAAARLLRILQEETHVTTISAASTDDVLAFVAATLLSTTEPERQNLLARTLIVYDAGTLRQLDTTSDLLILLPYEAELRREAQLVQSNHVILLAPESGPADIEVPPIDRGVFDAALRDLGVDKNLAEKLTLAAHRSLVAFQTEAPSRAVGKRREWSKTFESKVIRRAWLAGGWHEARSGDTDALASFIGTVYDDIRAELQPVATGGDPVFTSVGGTWGLTAAEEAWRFGVAHITGPDLEALEALVQTVLGAVDPALELPADERWAAAIHGKSRIHSSDLRKGLATTLAACGAFGEDKQIGALGSAAEWAAGVVALARDPAFFVEILSLVYRPRGAEADVVEVPEHVATNAYRLLDEWRIIPGSRDRVSAVDGADLNRWTETARELLARAGRGEVGDVEIRKVLAHARGDDDGTWPTKPVRDLIEKVASPEIEEGFEIQIYNNRGPTSRGPFDGGAQERELVKKYTELADRIRDGWPRTAAVLTSLAQSYEREARRHDIDAERLRQGMDR
jgi:hypothetical protein